MSDDIIKVDDLAVSFDTEYGRVRAVDGLSFTVAKGKTLGIVGESGCGKSVTAMSMMRLLPKPAGQIDKGQILFDGTDLVALPAEKMHRIRGYRIAMIFQEPMSALNPVMRVGDQIAEALLLHHPQMDEEESRQKVVALMKRVGIPAPEKRVDEYPHQLSGGMRQRVVIAIALACEPDVLIADEPTTALDVTIQAQILALINELQDQFHMSVIFITHDLGVIAQLADEVLVMYGGRAVEQCSVEELFNEPKHPYTQGLLRSIPRLDHTPKTKLDTIEGMVPSLSQMPPGCRFQNRCLYAQDNCRTQPPEMEEISPNHHVRCFHWREIDK